MSAVDKIKNKAEELLARARRPRARRPTTPTSRPRPADQPRQRQAGRREGQGHLQVRGPPRGPSRSCGRASRRSDAGEQCADAGSSGRRRGSSPGLERVGGHPAHLAVLVGHHSPPPPGPTRRAAWRPPRTPGHHPGQRTSPRNACGATSTASSSRHSRTSIASSSSSPARPCRPELPLPASEPDPRRATSTRSPSTSAAPTTWTTSSARRWPRPPAGRGGPAWPRARAGGRRSGPAAPSTPHTVVPLDLLVDEGARAGGQEPPGVPHLGEQPAGGRRGRRRAGVRARPRSGARARAARAHARRRRSPSAAPPPAW